MKLRKPLVAAGAVFTLVTAAWAADTVLATAGNAQVTESDVRSLLREKSLDIGQVPAPALENAVAAELGHRLIVSEAKKAGWDKKPEVQKAMARASENALALLYVSAQSEPPAAYPSDADMHTFYDNNKAKFLNPKRVALAQIFLAGTDDATVKRAQALDADLKLHPEKFAEVAAKQSDDKASAPRGGNMGVVPVANLSPTIAAGIASLAKGQVSSVIADTAGQHILLVEDRADESQATFEEARSQIAAYLRQQRTRELEAAYLEHLRTQYPGNLNKPAIDALAAPASAAGAAPAH